MDRTGPWGERSLGALKASVGIGKVFSKEAVWACALHACSKRQIAVGQEGLGGVPLHELLENVIFMDKLFAREVSSRFFVILDVSPLYLYMRLMLYVYDVGGRVSDFS